MVVAFEFFADAEGGVGLVHAAGEGDRHGEDHLGDGAGIDGCGREHGDTAAVALGVVDVGEEIAFDGEDGAQVRGAVEARAVEGRLTDQGNRVWQMAVEVIGRGGGAVVPEHAAEAFEAALGRFVEDAVEATRVRIEEDEAFLGGRGNG